MDSIPNIDEFAKAVTRGLAADAELRLDAQAEITSHLEERRDSYLAEGKSATESEELALKSFGPPLPIGEAFLKANRRRMKVRALVQLAMQSILVPAALLMAAYMLLYRADASFYFTDNASIRNELLSFFTSSREGYSQHQENAGKALIDTPENKVTFARYADIAIVDNYQNTDKAIEILRNGERIDPDNARYNILIAALMLKNACRMAIAKSTDIIGGPLFQSQPDFIICVKDEQNSFAVSNRRRLDEAFTELQKASQKPRYTQYLNEWRQGQVGRYKKVGHYENAWDQLAILSAYSSMKSDTVSGLEITKIAPYYARMCLSEQRTDDARRALDSSFELWQRALLCGDSYSDALHIVWGIESMVKSIAPIYESMDDPEKAKKVRDIAKAIKDVLDNKGDSEKRQADWEKSQAYFFNHASRLERNFTGNPMSGILPSVEALSSGRELEYVLLMRVLTTGFVCFLVALILWSIMVYGHWQIKLGADDAPLLLLPNGAELLRITGYGVFLPLCLYLIYSKLEFINGREYSIHHHCRPDIK